MTAPHRIRTLRLDLRAPGPEDAFRLRRAVAASVRSAGFARGLEILLDGLAPGGTEYRIDRLEVSLTGLTAAAWEHDGTAHLLAALETALTRELRRAVPATGADSDFPEQPDARVLRRTAPESTFDAFAAFLKTGVLPWWAAPDAGKHWETEVPAAVQRQPERAKAALASALSEPEAARRLVWQLSWKTILLLLEPLAGEDAVRHVRRWETTLARGFRLRRKSAEPLRETVEAERAAWVTALATRNWRADAAWLRGETQRIEAAWANPAQVNHPAPASEPGGGAEAAGVTAHATRNWRADAAWLRGETQRLEAGGAGSDRVDHPAPASEPGGGAEAAGAGDEPERPETPPTAGGPERGALVSEEKIPVAPPEPAFFSETDPVRFIANAGLVLLHPFVAALLAGLGFLENGRFRSDHHRHRAVHLLAHAVGQGPFPAESELLLPKILLGFAPETPLRRRVRLSQTEKAEVRGLLEAVIGHWSVLKNTSPETVQAEFLRREGRLERRTDAWALTVEQRASDVLLGRLPWGISLIRLPWMPGWLHVTWN